VVRRKVCSCGRDISHLSFVVSRNEQIRGYYTTDDVGDLLKGFWKTEKDDDENLRKFVQQTAELSLEMVVLFVDSSVCEFGSNYSPIS
jgi:hypothetical protein